MHASYEALTPSLTPTHPDSPRLTLLARCGWLKRPGVGEREGELGADFASLVLPRFLLKLNLSAQHGGVAHRPNFLRRFTAQSTTACRPCTHRIRETISLSRSFPSILHDD